MSEEELFDVDLAPIGQVKTAEIRATNVLSGRAFKPFSATFDVPDQEALLGAIIVEGNHSNPVTVGKARRQFVQAHLKNWTLPHDPHTAETWRGLDPFVTLELYNAMCDAARAAKNF